MSDADPTVKYLVLQQGGDFVLEVPAAYKLTFGAVNPGNSGMGGRDLHCLRVWESYNGGKGILRAVFCDVRGFRDLTIPLARKIQKETGSAEWTMDSAGNFERSSQREIEAEYVEDAPF